MSYIKKNEVVSSTTSLTIILNILPVYLTGAVQLLSDFDVARIQGTYRKFIEQ